jgi:hypothetical protein
MKLPGLICTLLYAAVLAAAGLGVRETLRVMIAPSAAAKTMPGCLPSRDGYLRARARGANQIDDMDIDWRDADMQCDGGLRPEQRGMRVTFAGRAPNTGATIRLVFGIAADPAAATAANVPANVTVIFEDRNKLYSTAGDNKCTIDSLQQSDMHDAHWRRVVARGFCTASATAIDGTEALLLDRFDFAGAIRTEESP